MYTNAQTDATQCITAPHSRTAKCITMRNIWQVPWPHWDSCRDPLIGSLSIIRHLYFYRATQLCERGLDSRESPFVRLFVRPFVCLSDTRMLCDKTKQYTAGILILQETTVILVFGYQQWLVGDAPSVWNLRSKWSISFRRNADFDRFPLITSRS